jgi:hypothetical protein
VAHHDESVYKKWLKPCIPAKKTILVKDAPGLDSMSKKYNEGVDRLKRKLKQKLKKDDIVVFVHEDIKIDDNTFEPKLEHYFKIDPNLGVAGVYGSRAYAGAGWWHYERETYSCGKITQGFKDGSTVVMQNNSVPFTNDMVIVDGCMLAIRGDLVLNQKFDETLPGWHHYDNSYCLETLINTDYKVGVIDTSLTHLSEGDLDQAWVDGAKELANRYINKGYNLPLTTQYLTEKRNEKLNQ